jgi:Protein of unknown function (DUF5674)
VAGLTTALGFRSTGKPLERQGEFYLIVIIDTRATPEQIKQMLLEHKFYIKVVVDIERRILAGGGDMHYDCEQVLLAEGSRQQDIWGAGYMPSTRNITYDSIINLRPRQNRSMEILDATIRERVAQIITEFLGDI